MRFTTKSGAVYDLFEVEGENVLTRDCEQPIVDWGTGRDAGVEVVGQRVEFDRPPTIGERFEYLVPGVGPVLSTAVVSIEGAS